MHIHWLASERFDNIHALYATPLASLRLRAGALLSVLPPNAVLTAGPLIHAQAQVCVIGKIGVNDLAKRQVQWLDQISQFKGRVVLDFTDDRVKTTSKMSNFYIQCLALSHVAVSSSAWLQSQLENLFLGPTRVISDAIECPILTPKSNQANPYQIMWFGHSTNLPALIDFLPSIPQAVTLHLLTNDNGIQQIQAMTDLPPGVTLVPAKWSPASMVKTALKCQMCIIPVGLDNAQKAGVSSNRLLTALALGLPTSADVTASYSEFRNDFADLRSDEFANMLRAPEIWHARVQSAQAQILPAYAFPQLGQQWLDLFQSLS